MTVLAVQTPVVKDNRNHLIVSGTHVPTADSAYESGYYWGLSTQDNIKAFMPDKTLATGESMWVRFEWAATAWSSLTSGTKYLVFQIYGSRTVLTTNPICRIAIDGNTAASPNMDFRFTDANGNTTVSASSYTYGLGRVSFMVLITKDSSTQVTAKLYEGTTEKMTLTHTAGGGVGTLTFKGIVAGFLDAVPKGATIAVRVGTFKVHDSLGSGVVAAAPTTTSRIQANTSNVPLETGAQPTSIPDENGFRNTADSGAAVVTEVDDPFNTADTTRDDDFNQSTSSTSAFTQSYGFPTTSLGLSAGDLPETNVNSANIKVRKEVTGVARNIKVYSINRLLYYEPSDRIMAVVAATDIEGHLGATGTVSLVFDDGTEASLDGVLETAFPTGARATLMRLWTALPSGVPATGTTRTFAAIF